MLQHPVLCLYQLGYDIPNSNLAVLSWIWIFYLWGWNVPDPFKVSPAPLCFYGSWRIRYLKIEQSCPWNTPLEWGWISVMMSLLGFIRSKQLSSSGSIAAIMCDSQAKIYTNIRHQTWKNSYRRATTPILQFSADGKDLEVYKLSIFYDVLHKNMAP